MSVLRSEVIAALKNCIEREYSTYPDGCLDCKYFLKDPDCMIAMMMDALTYIVSTEEQAKPHVMTLEELNALKKGAVVWRETRWPNLEGGPDPLLYRLDPAMREESDEFYTPSAFLVAWNGYDDLGDPNLLDRMDDDGQVRYWSSKPTDEQRRDTPWRT